MRTFALAASLAAFSSAQDPTTLRDGIPDPGAAYAAFRAAQGGDWVVQWHPATGTPSAIYGTGLPIPGWSENSLAAARAHAQALLVQHKELLGLGASEFHESIGARMGRTWSFKFDQYFRGVPVIDGRADVRINMAGVVAMLGSRAWPIPDAFDVLPAIAEEVAVAAAWAELGAPPTGVAQPGPAPRPRLVIWGDIHAPALAPTFLCWEVAISNVDAQGAGPIGRYYVDAKTAAVHAYHGDKHECGMPGCTPATHAARTVGLEAAGAASAPPIPTVVTIMAWTRTGNDAWSALVNTPLPGIELGVAGVGTVVTDANGQFTIDIANPVNVAVGALNGRHHATIAGVSAPSANVVVNPGVPATIQLLTAGATVNQAAHPTVSWWVDRVNEFCRDILGDTPQLATASAIVPTVNIANTCNAYYSNNTINFYQQGGCANTAFSTVIAHEWGHGLDHRYGGIANHYSEGLSEGWGDIIGMYLVDSPLLGSGFTNPNQPLRNGNNTFLWPHASTATAQNPNPAPHPAGQVWMGFAWKLRERLRTALGQQAALALSNDIVIGSIVADATTRVDAVREVFLADDNDGNLLNGTPNYMHLSGAAVDKAIPYPQANLGTLQHAPLASTTQRLTPRQVVATATPASGSYTQLRLHFNAGSGNVVRNMHPTGAANSYLAMLPGLPSGTVSYHIEAVHSTSLVQRLPATGEFTYGIADPTQGFFLANFDSGSAGWTSAQVQTQNDWQVGDPAGRTGISQGVAWADPQFAASAPNCFGNDLGGAGFNGAYQGNVENHVRSPVIDCTGRVGVRLRFKRWLTVEQGIYDQARVSVNGVQVWQNPPNGNLVDTAWVQVEYPLPAADNNPAVQLEWRLTSDDGLHLGGWNIDDVELVETLPVVVHAELRMLPEQAAQGAAMVASVSTPGSSRPYLLAIADQPGPTVIPGIATVDVGGNVGVFGGSTDASGNAVLAFTAPVVPAAVGLLYYSQVLTLDATFTQFVVSNPHVNLFTQTP